MIIDFSLWTRNNFFSLLQETLETLKNSSDTQLIVNLRECKEIDRKLLIRILNATIGQFYRAIFLDQKIGFDPRQTKINTLIIDGGDVNFINDFMKSFYRRHFFSITHFEIIITKPITNSLFIQDLQKYQLSSLKQISIKSESNDSNVTDDCDILATELSKSISKKIQVNYNRALLQDKPIQQIQNQTPQTLEPPSPVQITPQTNNPNASKELLSKFFELSDLIKFSDYRTLHYLPENYKDIEEQLLKVFFEYAKAKNTNNEETLKHEIVSLSQMIRQGFNEAEPNKKPPILARFELFLNSKVHELNNKKYLEGAKAFYDGFIKYGAIPTTQVMVAWKLFLSREYDACCLPLSDSLAKFRTDAENQALLKKIPFIQKIISNKIFSNPIPILQFFTQQLNQLKKLNIDLEEVGKLLHELITTLGAETTSRLLLIFKKEANSIAFLPLVLSYSLQLSSLDSKKSDIKVLSEELIAFILILENKTIDKINWPKIKSEYEDLITTSYQKRYPEKPIEIVRKEFSQPSSDVEVCLPEAVIDKIFGEYELIKSKGEELIKLDNSNLSLLITNIQKPISQENKILLLAVIREQIRRHFKINLYNVQMINLLAMLHDPNKKLHPNNIDQMMLPKGRVAQIKTGEGKTPIIAAMAAYFAITEGWTDIVTTAQDLAERDYNKYRNFYMSLGITSGLLPLQNRLDKHYHPQVVYGILSSYEFDYLRRESGQVAIRINRPLKKIIVDEADNLFLDAQKTPAIISSEDKTKDPSLYNFIWAFATAIDRDPKISLQKYLEDKTGKKYDQEVIDRWMSGILTAKALSENIDYVLKKNPNYHPMLHKNEIEVVIVDQKNTGQLLAGQQWFNGTHCFLEVENGLTASVEYVTTAQTTNIDFFNLYEYIYGLTGTLGSRDELWGSYKIETYDSPPYRPSKRQQHPHIVVATEEEKIKAILKTVKEITSAGRPVLTLNETIKETQKYNQLFKESKITVQSYNGIQEESVDTIIGLAGNPSMVTTATNTAGRGADISPTPQAIENGGLHVTMTFPATSSRTEAQGFERAGRQGNWGSYQYILTIDQLLNFPYMEDVDPGDCTDIIKTWQEKRDQYMQKISNYRKKLKEFYHVEFMIQKFFFLLPVEIKSKVNSKWFEQYDNFVKTAQDLRVKSPLNLELLQKIKSIAINMVIKFWQQEILPTRSQNEFTSPLHLVVKHNDVKLIQWVIDDAPQLLGVLDKTDKTLLELTTNEVVINLLTKCIELFKQKLAAANSLTISSMTKIGFLASNQSQENEFNIFDSMSEENESDEDISMEEIEEFEEDEMDQDELQDQIQDGKEEIRP